MIALYIVLGIIAFIFLLLCIPVSVKAVYKDELGLTLRYAFFKFDLLKEHDEKEEKQEDETEEKESKFKLKDMLKNHGVKNFLDIIKELFLIATKSLFNILKHIKVKELSIDFTAAAEEPGDAALLYGKVCGIIYPFYSLLLANCKVKKSSVNVDLNYNEESPKVGATLEISLLPIYLCAHGVALLVRVLPRVKKLVSSKKTNKKGELANE